MENESLDVTIYRLSSEAFGLAQQAARAADVDQPDFESRAREINDRLDQAWARLQAEPSSDPGVTRAWSDARLDVGWILSHGELSPSPRLAQSLGGAASG